MLFTRSTSNSIRREKKLCTRLQSTRVTLSFLVVRSIWWWPYTHSHTHTSAFLVAFWRYHKNKIANTRFFLSPSEWFHPQNRHLIGMAVFVSSLFPACHTHTNSHQQNQNSAKTGPVHTFPHVKLYLGGKKFVSHQIPATTNIYIDSFPLRFFIGNSIYRSKFTLFLSDSVFFSSIATFKFPLQWCTFIHRAIKTTIDCDYYGKEKRISAYHSSKCNQSKMYMVTLLHSINSYGSITIYRKQNWSPLKIIKPFFSPSPFCALSLSFHLSLSLWRS